MLRLPKKDSQKRYFLSELQRFCQSFDWRDRVYRKWTLPNLLQKQDNIHTCKKSSNKKLKVINMNNPSDTSHDTIQDLFYQQVRRLSVKPQAQESFDLQFSDQWF